MFTSLEEWLEPRFHISLSEFFSDKFLLYFIVIGDTGNLKEAFSWPFDRIRGRIQGRGESRARGMLLAIFLPSSLPLFSPYLTTIAFPTINHNNDVQEKSLMNKVNNLGYCFFGGRGGEPLTPQQTSTHDPRRPDKLQKLFV